MEEMPRIKSFRISFRISLNLDKVDELLRVLADDDSAGVAGHVVPCDTVAVLVVLDGQAGLVVVLLETLDGQADVVLSLDRALADSLVVVGLAAALPAMTKNLDLPEEKHFIFKSSSTAQCTSHCSVFTYKVSVQCS